MECPYCKQEMKRGHLKGDGRQKVRWQEEGKKIAFVDKIAGTGELEVAEYGFGTFKIFGTYCEGCKKLIIETGISE